MDEMEQYRELFMTEAEEHLQALNQYLVELENDPNNMDIVNQIFRSAHTLKGSARTLGFDHISSLTHHMEDILDLIREGQIPVTSEVIDVLFKCLDALETMVNEVGEGIDTTSVDVDSIIKEIESIKNKHLSGEVTREEPETKEEEKGEKKEKTESEKETETSEKKTVKKIVKKHVKVVLKEPQTTVNVSKEVSTEEEIKIPENFDMIVEQIQNSAELLHVLTNAFDHKELSDALKKIGDLADSVLKRNIHLNKSIMDVLKESLTALEKIAKCIEEKKSIDSLDIDLSELSNKIEEAMTQEPTPKVEEFEVTLDHSIFNLDDVAEHIKEMVDNGYKLYHVKAKTAEDCALKSVRLVMVLTKIREIGELLKSIPTEEEIKEKSYEELDAIFLSNKELDEIKEVFDTISEMDYIVVVPVDVEFEIEEIGEEVDVKEEKEEKTEATEASELSDAYKVKVIIDDECLLKSVRAYMTIKELKNLGDILKTEPPIEVIESGEFKGTEVIIYMNLNIGKEVDDIKEVVLSIPEIKEVIVIPPGEAPKEETTEVQKETKGVKKEETKPPEQKQQPTSAPKKQTETKKSSSTTQTIRVNIEKLDKLMNLVGELVINRANFAQIASKYDIKELHNAVNRLNMLITELQEEVMAMRMIPVAFVFNRFPRTVRDIARALKKEVNFIIEGSEIELDRTVLDELAEPLTHLIRNALDHGIEPPEEREKLGKPRKGTLKLIAERERDHVNIIVEDDGRGIDPDKIRKKAVERGLLTEEEAKKLSDSEAIQLIFLPGFSTAEKVSDVSGRGVGMDVVKSKIESLGGSVSIESEKGKGTRVILQLPLTMAIIQVLLVKLNNQVYAIPLTSVLDVASVQKDEIKNLEGQEAIIYRDEILPVFWLKNILNQYSNSEKDELYVVVLERNKGKVGIIVDDVIGRDEIVVKPLTGILKNISGLAGATILGDGSVALILDLSNI